MADTKLRVKNEEFKAGGKARLGGCLATREGSTPTLSPILRYEQLIKSRRSVLTHRESIVREGLRKKFPATPLPKGKPFFTMPKSTPREYQMFMDNFRTTHINFWNKTHPLYPSMPELPAVLGKIIRFGTGHHKPKDPEKRAGDSSTPSYGEEIDRLRGNRVVEQLKKRQKTLQAFFSQPQAQGGGGRRGTRVRRSSLGLRS